MTITRVLIRKHKIMTCVFEELNKLYGQPTWLTNPKNGQDPKVIIDQWIKELGDYDENILKRACKSLYANDRVSRFPTLAHVLNEIKSLRATRQVENAKTTPKFFSIEQVFIERAKELGRPFYASSRYRRTIDYILGKRLKEEIGDQKYQQLERDYPDYNTLRGAKYRMAEEKGLFSEFDEIIEKIYDL